MSESVFQSMPENYQKIIIDSVWEYGEKFTKYTLDNADEVMKKMKDAGVTFFEPDVDSFITAASAMYKSGNLKFSAGLFEKIQAIIK